MCILIANKSESPNLIDIPALEHKTVSIYIGHKNEMMTIIILQKDWNDSTCYWSLSNGDSNDCWRENILEEYIIKNTLQINEKTMQISLDKSSKNKPRNM